MKGVIVLLLLAASAVSAFYFHGEVRDLYLKTYYLRVKKITPALAEKKAQKMYLDNEYVRALVFSRDLLRIFPGNAVLKKTAGLAALKTGDTLGGAGFLMPVLTDDPDDRSLLREVAEALYSEKYYSDVATLLTRIPPGKDPELTFYMGASLSGIGRYGDALPFLEISEGRGGNNPEVHYFLGLAREKTGRENDAMDHYRETLKRNPFHREARKALLELYSKKKMFREAEKLLRGRIF